MSSPMFSLVLLHFYQLKISKKQVKQRTSIESNPDINRSLKYGINIKKIDPVGLLTWKNHFLCLCYFLSSGQQSLTSSLSPISSAFDTANSNIFLLRAIELNTSQYDKMIFKEISRNLISNQVLLSSLALCLAAH